MQSGEQEEQEQATQAEYYDRDEEYRAARRAGAEAVEIGRETLEEATRQGEQLENAEKIADDTSYKLDKAGRILRGMTWSGWVANAFSKELKSPGTEDNAEQNTKIAMVPSVYEDVPPPCRNAAQAIQNYNANLKVLTTCETEEQEETCQLICENMYEVAKKELDKLFDNAIVEVGNQAFVMRLQKDLGNLRSRQEIKRRILQRQQREKEQAADFNNSRETLNLEDGSDQDGKSSKPTEPTDFSSPETRAILRQQDEHIDGIAHNLEELGSLAINLSEATEKQGALVDMLDTKSDNVLDKTKMVTRRADRLVQKKSWTPAKPILHSFVSVQHAPTKKYLSVVQGSLVLRSVVDQETCIFGLWKRQGDIFGLQSRFNRRWVGQSLLGNLECNASSFGRRQEFETEKRWNETPLLCASAGWGTGSYVVVRGKEETVNIATTGTVTGKTADHWCLKETHTD